jgi:hypothetical protein
MIDLNFDKIAAVGSAENPRKIRITSRVRTKVEILLALKSEPHTELIQEKNFA